MIKKTLKTVLFLFVAASGLASAQVTPCSICDVSLNRCLTNGAMSEAQCYQNYANCRAEACPAP